MLVNFVLKLDVIERFTKDDKLLTQNILIMIYFAF